MSVGDRVIAPYYLTCRKCPACLRGDFNLCQRAYAFWSRPPEERVGQVQELTGGYGADAVLEVTGVPAAFLEALQLARPGGKVLEIGNVSLGKEHEISLAPRRRLRAQILLGGPRRAYHARADSHRESNGSRLERNPKRQTPTLAIACSR